MASEIGDVMAKTARWFVRNDTVVAIGQIATGFEFSSQEDQKFKISSTSAGFRPLSGTEAKYELEQFITPTVFARPSPNAPAIMVTKSYTTDFCNGLVQSPQLKAKLPVLTRILTCPLPLRINGTDLIYPKPGYDERFGTYLLPNAPVLHPMKVEDALTLLQDLLSDFCITEAQSVTHAYARLFTPFARGLLGWTTRTPLFAFLANRPRVGKDYLAACAIILYEGHPFEDQPIEKNPQETAKRLISAASAGRRFMHFSNCQGHLSDPFLAQALTNPTLRGRLLGANNAASDLEVPNEMDFSLSGNIGLTWREDFGFRMRQINLAFFQEDPNTRIFRNPLLHHSLTQNRPEFLSALNSCWSHWAKSGCPAGTTPFASYPQWARLLGGLLHRSLSLGDPCLPQADPTGFAGDLKTEAMRALFKLCFEAFPNQPISKSKIASLLAHSFASGDFDHCLSWFGSFDEDKADSSLMRLGRALHAFNHRELSAIRLSIDSSSSHSQRHMFTFSPIR